MPAPRLNAAARITSIQKSDLAREPWFAWTFFSATRPLKRSA